MKKMKIVYRMVGEIVINADSEEKAREQFMGFPDEVLFQNVDLQAHITDVFQTDEDVTKL